MLKGEYIWSSHLWDQATFFLGLDISVLRAIHNLVQEKASRLHMWKGKKKTKGKYIGKVYIEVSKVFCISLVTRSCCNYYLHVYV